MDIREGNVPARRKRLLCKGPEATACMVGVSQGQQSVARADGAKG